MDVTLYGLTACDTCRKARKILENKGYSITFVDVRGAPLAEDTHRRFLAAFNEDVINRRSTTWRGLDETARSASALELLQAHPALMKRPVLEAGSALYLGWTKEVQSALGV